VVGIAAGPTVAPTVVPPAETPPVQAATPVVVAPSTPITVSRVKWRRKIEGGYNYQAAGSNVATHSMFARGEISRSTPSGSNLIDARYYYGSQNSIRNNDRLSITLKSRETLLKRIEFRNDLSYGYDYLKALSHQFEDVFGLTFVVFDKSRFRYAIGPGLGVQYAEPALGGTGFKVVGDITHDVRWQLTEQISLNNRCSYLYEPGNLTDYRLRSDSVLSASVAKGVSVNLRYEYEYEAIRSVVAGRSDHRVFTTLGYEF
jgi:putative salt-induced outer membrane protein YdiY